MPVGCSDGPDTRGAQRRNGCFGAAHGTREFRPKWTQRAALTSLSSGSERLRTLVSVWGPQPGPVDREDQSPTRPEHSTLAHGGCSLRACVNTLEPEHSHLALEPGNHTLTSFLELTPPGQHQLLVPWASSVLAALGMAHPLICLSLQPGLLRSLQYPAHGWHRPK